MTDWQKAGTHVAGYAVLAVGACALAARHGWPAVAALAVGVVLVLGALALETWAGMRQADKDVTRLEGLETKTAALATALHKATKDAEKAAKDADAALAAALRLTNGRTRGEPEY